MNELETLNFPDLVIPGATAADAITIRPIANNDELIFIGLIPFFLCLCNCELEQAPCHVRWTSRITKTVCKQEFSG